MEKVTNKNAVLFISYDGILDPLGKSQILPYISQIMKTQKVYFLLSFEKKYRISKYAVKVSKELADLGINWRFLCFTKKYGVLGKAWDIMRMYIYAIYICSCFKINIVHARGHFPAQVGLFIRKFLKLKVIFDFRGLWVDEKIEKSDWSLNKLRYRIIYNKLKKNEQKMIKSCDHLVVLTKSMSDEAKKILTCSVEKITIIPCCVDYTIFKPSSNREKIILKSKLGIELDSKVLVYLGSVGGVYNLAPIFQLFKIISMSHKVHLLVLTPDKEEFICEMNSFLPKSYHKKVHIVFAERNQVPYFLSIASALIFCYKNSYARKATCPTRLAEAFSVGVPCIAGEGVGDVSDILKSLDGGVEFDPNSISSMERIANSFSEIASLGGRRLRSSSRNLFDISVASRLYKDIYERVS